MASVIPPDLLQRIREANDIVEVVRSYGVELKPKSRNMFGLCPFHEEKTPSFSVRPDGQFFYCFGCGKKGDVFSFVMEIESVTFPEAAEMLAGRAGIPIVRDERDAEEAKRKGKWKNYLYDLNRLAASFYRRKLGEPEGEAARQYLVGRGVSEASAERFGLGWAPPGGTQLVSFLQARKAHPRALEQAGLAYATSSGLRDFFDDGRIIFPIHDRQGRVIAFTGRILHPEASDKGKYINTRKTDLYDKSRVFYGFHLARDAMRKKRQAIIVEGQMDVVLCHQHGFDNAVACGGTALSPHLVGQFRHYLDVSRGELFDVVLVKDADEAGQRSAEADVETFVQQDVPGRCLTLRGGKDPADLLIAEGPEALARQLAAAADLFEFKVRRVLERIRPERPEEARLAARELLRVAGLAEDRLLREKYRQKIAGSLGLRIEDLRFPRGGKSAAAPAATSGEGGSREPEAPSPQADSRVAQAEQELLWFLLHFPEWLEEASLEFDLTALRTPELREVGEALLRHLDAGSQLNVAALVGALAEAKAQEKAIALLARELKRGKIPPAEDLRARLNAVRCEHLRARVAELELEATRRRAAGEEAGARRLKDEAARLRQEVHRRESDRRE